MVEDDELGDKSVVEVMEMLDREIDKSAVEPIYNLLDRFSEQWDTGSEEVLHKYNADTDLSERDTTDSKAVQFVGYEIGGGDLVTLNRFTSTSVVEVLVPQSSVDIAQELVDTWNLNPKKRDTIDQPPSFEKEYPKIADEMRGFQFLLNSDSDQLSSSTYDIEPIIEDLQANGVPYLVTISADLRDRLDLSVFRYHDSR